MSDDRERELARLIKALDRKAFIEQRELTPDEAEQRASWRAEQDRLIFSH